MILNRQSEVRVSLEPLAEFSERARRLLRIRRDAFSVCLVSDTEIAGLNRTFRGKAGATNVLSFPVDGVAREEEEKDDAEAQRAQRKRRGRRKQSDAEAEWKRRRGNYLGDIAISPATARRNARRDDRPLSDELRILILHGMLHLLGYDHESDDGEMLRLEQKLRRRLRIA